MSGTGLLSDFIRSVDEIIQFVARGLSGYSGLMREISPIHSHIANQTVNGPSYWFVPVMTTEACPHLISRRDADGNSHHIVV